MCNFSEPYRDAFSSFRRFSSRRKLSRRNQMRRSRLCYTFSRGESTSVVKDDGFLHLLNGDVRPQIRGLYHRYHEEYLNAYRSY